MGDQEPHEDQEPDAAYLKAHDAALAPTIAERIADRLEKALEAIGRSTPESER